MRALIDMAADRGAFIELGHPRGGWDDGHAACRRPACLFTAEQGSLHDVVVIGHPFLSPTRNPPKGVD